jgi:hypothetical protein
MVSINMMTPTVILKKKYIPKAIVRTLALWIPPPIVFDKNTLES